MRAARRERSASSTPPRSPVTLFPLPHGGGVLKPVLLATMKIPDFALLGLSPEDKARLESDSIVELYRFKPKRSYGYYGGVLYRMPTGNYVSVMAKPMKRPDDKLTFRSYGRWMVEYMQLFDAFGVERPKPIAVWGTLAIHLIPPTATIKAIMIDYAYTVSKLKDILREYELVRRVYNTVSKIYSEIPELRGKLDLLLSRSESEAEALERILAATAEILGRLEEQGKLLRLIQESASKIDTLIDVLADLLDAGDVEGARRVLAQMKGEAVVVEEGARMLGEGLPDFARDNPWLKVLSERR